MYKNCHVTTNSCNWSKQRCPAGSTKSLTIHHQGEL